MEARLSSVENRVDYADDVVPLIENPSTLKVFLDRLNERTNMLGTHFACPKRKPCCRTGLA